MVDELHTTTQRVLSGFYFNYFNLLCNTIFYPLKFLPIGGGGKGIEKARLRHTERGKLLARDRVKYLLDPNSPFLEFSQLAALNMYGVDEIASAGMITGIGRIQGLIAFLST